MEKGGTITTDLWKAYPIAAREADVLHRTVNHSKEFVSEDGVHTNNVKGIVKTNKC